MKATETTKDLTQFTGTWALDPKRSSVTFRTKAMWVVPVKGTFKVLEGNANITFDGAVAGRLVMDAASVNTRITKRDNHLRSGDFLEVVEHRTIVFEVSSGLSIGSDLIELSGVLTIHGQTQPLTLRVSVTGTGSSATVSTNVEIDRSLWGLTWTNMGTRWEIGPNHGPSGWHYYCTNELVV
jgi:polyisoprenoid-binding protein YceI